MTYFQAVITALFINWNDYIKDDAVHGNGFVIFFYGLKLIIGYAFYFLFRIVIALTFPISAILIMKVYKNNIKKTKEATDKIDQLSS